MDVVMTSRRLHGRETQVKRGCHVIRSTTQEIETRAADWMYWKKPTLIWGRLNKLRPPPPLSITSWYVHDSCLSLSSTVFSISSLCGLPVQADGGFGCWNQRRRQQKRGSFPTYSLYACGYRRGVTRWRTLDAQHSPHSPHPDRTLCFCPPVPIVLMPNLQMDLVCKVSLIRRFLLRPGLIFRDGIANWHWT